MQISQAASVISLALVTLFFPGSFSYLLDLSRSSASYKCSKSGDYDLKSYDYWDIYSTGSLAVNNCLLEFEAESRPYQLTVQIIRPISASTRSNFYILLQTRNSKRSPWGGDVKISTRGRNIMGSINFHRRLRITISGDRSERVQFKIRVQIRNRSSHTGTGGGFASWIIGVIIVGIIGVIFCGVCGSCFYRRRMRGQSGFGGFNVFSRPTAYGGQPYVSTTTAYPAAAPVVVNSPPAVYPTGGTAAHYPTQPGYPTQNHAPYPGQAPLYQASSAAPPPAPAAPPPPGFVNPPGAPPPYSAVPPPPVATAPAADFNK